MVRRHQKGAYMNYFISGTRSELRLLRDVLDELDTNLEGFSKDAENDEQIEIRLKTDSDIEITLKDSYWSDILKKSDR